MYEDGFILVPHFFNEFQTRINYGVGYHRRVVAVDQIQSHDIALTSDEILRIFGSAEAGVSEHGAMRIGAVFAATQSCPTFRFGFIDITVAA
jgi:hypothetical protein